MFRILIVLAVSISAAGCGRTIQERQEGYAVQCERLGYRRGTEAFLQCFQIAGMQDASDRNRRAAVGVGLAQAGAIMAAPCNGCR